MIEKLENLMSQLSDIIQELKSNETAATKKTNKQKLHDFIEKNYSLTDEFRSGSKLYTSPVKSGYIEYYFDNSIGSGLSIEFFLTSVDIDTDSISSSISFNYQDLEQLKFDTENDIINFLTENIALRITNCYKTLKELKNDKT